MFCEPSSIFKYNLITKLITQGKSGQIRPHIQSLIILFNSKIPMLIHLRIRTSIERNINHMNTCVGTSENEPHHDGQLAGDLQMHEGHRPAAAV